MRQRAPFAMLETSAVRKSLARVSDGDLVGDKIKVMTGVDQEAEKMLGLVPQSFGFASVESDKDDRAIRNSDHAIYDT